MQRLKPDNTRAGQPFSGDSSLMRAGGCEMDGSVGAEGQGDAMLPAEEIVRAGALMTPLQRKSSMDDVSPLFLGWRPPPPRRVTTGCLLPLVW